MLQFRRAVWVLLGAFLVSADLWAQTAAVTRQQIREFLRSADVVTAEQLSTGTTRPWRLTLSDGSITHDAVFQSIDKQEANQRLGRGRELNFVDAYRYNIAAFQLAELIDLDHMMPVTVERTWNGRTGSLSWWIDDVMLDERTRLQERRWPEDIARWRTQMYRMLLFAELVHDTDRNQTNILYTRDWKLYMIDFSRAFRTWDDLQHPDELHKIDRELFARLQTLTTAQVEQAVGRHLTGSEVRAVLNRREKLVSHFQRLIAEKGARHVLD